MNTWPKEMELTVDNFVEVVFLKKILSDTEAIYTASGEKDKNGFIYIK